LGLRALLHLSRDEVSANVLLVAYDTLPSSLTAHMDIATEIATHEILDRLERHMIILTLTASKHLGRIPECVITDGDEIWGLLGCNVPIVVRPQPSGNSWFIYPAEIPGTQEHADLRDLSSDVKVGDRFGDWVVEDTELE
jgi:hypothetical protein